MCSNVFILLLFCLSFIFTIQDGYKVVAVKTNAKGSSNDQATVSPATENSIIPDLNYFPPPLLVKAKDGKMKTRHAILIESKIRKGTLEDFRKKENQRHMNYRKNLTDEERIALSRKHQDILRTKLKTSTEAHEKRKEVLREAARRFHARKRAKELGIQVEPENALKKKDDKEDKNDQSDKVNLERTKKSDELAVPLFDLNKSPPKEDDELAISQSIDKSVNKKRKKGVRTQEQIREGWRKRKRSSRANMDPIKKNEQNRKWHKNLTEKLLNGPQHALDKFRAGRNEAGRRQRAAKKARKEAAEGKTKSD